MLSASLFLLGCQGNADRPAPEGHDAAAARSILEQALDGWKKGEARSLGKRNPPIRLSDDDLAAGFRLSSYEIVEPNSPIEIGRDVHVVLSLLDRKGGAVRREACYQVSTHPSAAVLRSDP